MARITSIKKEMVNRVKPLLTPEYSYHDSALLIADNDCPAVCISSDHQSEYEEIAPGLFKTKTPITLDIYTTLDVPATDGLTDSVIQTMLSDRSLGQQAIDISLDATSTITEGGAKPLRIILFDFSVSYYKELAPA